MNRFLVIVLLVLLSAIIPPARAAKCTWTVTPENSGAHGFSVKAETRTDGAIEFTVTRDISKAKQFPEGSGVLISRQATLRVADDSGVRAVCSLAPSGRERNSNAYRFTVAKDCVAYSSFELAEDHDYQDQAREHLIGGGDHYAFDLSLFGGGRLR